MIDPGYILDNITCWMIYNSSTWMYYLLGALITWLIVKCLWRAKEKNDDDRRQQRNLDRQVKEAKERGPNAYL